jgi:hypothetical protein
MRLTYGARSFRLTGNVERPIEREMLELGEIQPADVLKVAHHGSRTSSTEDFVDAVHPAFAVISAGFENSYGHPHRPIIGRLDDRHTTIFRTDLNGLITIRLTESTSRLTRLRRVTIDRVRLALLAFGLLNAILYAGLMPLWEGFDEPLHYGYVQHLWTARSLPVQRQTTLSEEAWQSIALAPASPVVKFNLPMVTTYDDFFRLPPEERLARRRRLEQLDPALAAVPSQSPNYESQQAPLAYVILAPCNALWSHIPLPARIWRLRLICAIIATLAAGLVLLRLARVLGLDRQAQLAALFLLFSCQVFYATTAHVANDWLALPLFLLVLTSAVEFRPFWMAVALTAGLLTKAYFLAMIPFAVLLVLFRRRIRGALLVAAIIVIPTAPLYVRNLVLYHDLGGQQENLGGTPIGVLIRAAFQIAPARAFAATATHSLWTGNNSFTTFSTITLWIMIVLLLIAVVFYVRRRPSAAERVLLAGMVCYGAALFYNTVFQFVSTKGAAIAPSPWYTQLLWPAAVCLLLIRAPRWLRIALCCVSAYIISATYVAKLIPLYAGNSARPAHLAELVHWYIHSYPGMLDTTALISPAWILTLTIAVVLSAVAFPCYLFLTHK